MSEEYWIIDTLEKYKEFSPKMATDEILNEDGKWGSVTDNGLFSLKDTYRRRKPVPEPQSGWILISERKPVAPCVCGYWSGISQRIVAFYCQEHVDHLPPVFTHCLPIPSLPPIESEFEKAWKNHVDQEISIPPSMIDFKAGYEAAKKKDGKCR